MQTARTVTIRRLTLALVWVGFIAYAVVLAPPDQPETIALIQRLASGDWAEINPAIVALFNLMGLWPLVYAALLLVDGAGQRVWAWPFALGSFALGAFALLPYLVLRSPNPLAPSTPSLVLRGLESRGLGVLVLVGAIALMGYGLAAGDWPDFVAQWQTSRFIHVMSLDFCALWLLVPTLLGDDMARRGLKLGSPLTWLMVIPLIGAALYLTLRPTLPAIATPAQAEG